MRLVLDVFELKVGCIAEWGDDHGKRSYHETSRPYVGGVEGESTAADISTYCLLIPGDCFHHVTAYAWASSICNSLDRRV